MSAAAVKQSPSPPAPEVAEPVPSGPELGAACQRQAEFLRLLWSRRRVFLRVAAIAVLASNLLAFLIPKSYTSTAKLMPPDTQSPSGLAMMAAMAAKVGGGLGMMASDLAGLKSSGALFIGILRSETAQDRVIGEFDLNKIYGTRLLVDARAKLEENTSISEDRKNGIVSISVTDHSPQRAAAIANAYIDELNSLVAELSTSAAHRQRVFLEERLKVAKRDLDDATDALAQFSSKNNTLDIQTEGKAMLDTAASIAGELIAAQAQLEGLRKIYTGNNTRVKSLNAHVAELRKQLAMLDGAQRIAVNVGDSLPEQSADPPRQSADAPLERATSIPFPTIRNLPLLGAKWSDYYRRAKIQETVFELLTEQYELAKVEEAKETPSVKVLDPGRVPETKSSPPRLLIIFLGTFLVLSCSLVWALWAKSWEEADPRDPRKVLALEVVATVRAHQPWAAQNGTASSSMVQQIWNRFAGSNSSHGPMDR